MRFLIDNHLPPQLAVALRRHGHECRHVSDVALDEASDLELWAYATHGKWVVVSKDEDLVALANRLGDTGQLVWVRLGNCRNPALLAAFERVHDELIAALERGQRIVEVR